MSKSIDFVKDDGLIFVFNLTIFILIFSKFAFFHWSKLLILYLFLLPKFTVQLSKQVVISATRLLKLVDLRSWS